MFDSKNITQWFDCRVLIQVYEMLSDIKSFKRALGQVKLDSENKPKVLLRNHVSSASALELTEGFVQSKNITFFL